MALADVEGPSKKVAKPAAKAAKVVAKPAAPVAPLVPNTPYIDDTLAHSLFAPKAAGGQGITTQKAPSGGVIDYTIKDPNGYYWVDEPGGGGYWYRPEDGAEYRHTPVQGAADQAWASINRILGKETPVTNAQTVKGSPLKTPSKVDQMAEILGKGKTSTYKLPGAVTMDTAAGGFTGDIGAPDVGPYASYQSSSPLVEGDPAPPVKSGLIWVPPNPNGTNQQEREGYYRFDSAPPPSRLELKPRAGDGFGGLLADLTTSAMSRNTAEKLAWSPLNYIPGPVGEFTENLGANVIQNVTSPAGIAGLVFGSPVANVAGELGAGVGQTAGEAAGLPWWLTLPLAVAGGAGAGVGAGIAASGRPAARAIPAGQPGPADLVSPGARTIVEPPRPSRTPAQDLHQAARTALGEPVEAAPVPRADLVVSEPRTFRYPVDEPTPPVLRQPSPAPVPRAPVQGPAPDPRVTPSSKKPNAPASSITPAKLPARVKVGEPIEVSVDGKPVGTVTKAKPEGGARYTATYADPHVGQAPLLSASGEPARFVTFPGARNAVVNASEEVRARAATASAAPAAPAAPDIVPGGAPVRAGRWMVYFEDAADKAAYIAKDPRIRQVVANAADTGERAGTGTSFGGSFIVKRIPSQSRGATAPVHVRTLTAAELPTAPSEALEAVLRGGVQRAPMQGAAPARRVPRPRSDVDRIRDAQLRARGPYRPGAVVAYQGKVYEVRGVATGQKRLTLRNLDGTAAKTRGGQALTPLWDDVAPATVAPDEMPIRAMLRELEDFIPEDVRQRIYRDEAAWERDHNAGRSISVERAAAVRDVRTVLEEAVDSVRRDAEQVARASVPAIANDSALSEAVKRSALGVASPAVDDLVESAHREGLEAMGRSADDVTPGGAVPPAEAAGVEGMLSLVDQELRTAAEAELAGRRTVRAARAAGRATVEVVNAPRALKASGDLSFLLRQGAILGIRHPRAWRRAVSASLRNLKDPAIAGVVKDEIERVHRPWLYLSPTEGGQLALREEQFMSSIIGHIPKWIGGGVMRRLEESNLLFLNKLRADVYDQVVAGWVASGRDPSALELKGLADFINHATGRGTGAWLDKFGPALSVGMFAPRYTASRFQAPLDVLTATGRARSYAAGAMAANIGFHATATLSILGLLHHAGMDVTLDPRSSDFGKVKFPGGYVIDATAGMQQPVRFISQLASESYASASSGEVYPRSRQESVIRWLRSKASPLGGEVMDWFAPQYGFEERSVLGGVPGVGRFLEPIERLSIPITLANAFDYFDRASSPGGYVGALAATAAEFVGFGVSPREKSEWDKRDALIAKDEELAAYLLPGETEVNYNNLNDAGQLIAAERYGTPRPRSAAAIERRQQAEAIDAEYATKQAGLDARLEAWFDADAKRGDMMGPKDWRAAKRQLSAQRSAEKSQVYPDDMPIDERRIVDRWFEEMKRRTSADGLTVDWDALEEWEGKQSAADRKILDEYFALRDAEKTGMTADATRVSNALSEAAYFDLRDVAWAEWADAQGIDTAKYPDVWTWKAAKAEELLPGFIAEGMTASQARQEAAKAADKAVVEFNEHYEQRHLRPWIAEHPELAREAWDWQYLTPDEIERKAILGDTAELVGAREKFEAEARLKELKFEYKTDAWSRYLASGKAAADAKEYGSYDAYRAAWIAERTTPAMTPAQKADVADAFDSAAGGAWTKANNDAQIAAIIALARQDAELVKLAYANKLLGSLGKADREALAKAGVALE